MPTPNRTEPQPPLAVSFLSRLVISEFHEIDGAITSTCLSVAAVTHSIPPP